MAFEFQNNELGIKSESGFFNLKEFCQQRQSPFYIYDFNGVEKRVQQFYSSFKRNIKLHYAMKANNHPLLMQKMKELGTGVDVVSGGEIKEAIEAGFVGDDIIFSGVGKSINEIEYALEKNVYQINVESPQELERIGQIATSKNKKVAVAFRMNPDVNPDTHPYITTGFRDNKFGMSKSFLPELKKILKKYPEHLELQGLTLHIGSQIRDASPMYEAIEKTLVVYDSLKREGFPLKTFDIGGGLGMNYEQMDDRSDDSLISDYGQRVSEIFSDFDGELLCEPGRILVARYGALLGEIQYIKESPYKRFAIVNTGMHHLMRPCLYQAHHNIVKVDSTVDSEKAVYDIVGPICESSDVVGFERNLPKLKQGDWLAILEAGAYGKVMSSNYNSHGEVEEIVVYNNEVISKI